MFSHYDKCIPLMLVVIVNACDKQNIFMFKYNKQCFITTIASAQQIILTYCLESINNRAKQFKWGTIALNLMTYLPYINLAFANDL